MVRRTRESVRYHGKRKFFKTIKKSNDFFVRLANENEKEKMRILKLWEDDFPPTTFQPSPVRSYSFFKKHFFRNTSRTYNCAIKLNTGENKDELEDIISKSGSITMKKRTDEESGFVSRSSSKMDGQRYQRRKFISNNISQTKSQYKVRILDFDSSPSSWETSPFRRHSSYDRTTITKDSISKYRKRTSSNERDSGFVNRANTNYHPRLMRKNRKKCQMKKSFRISESESEETVLRYRVKKIKRQTLPEQIGIPSTPPEPYVSSAESVDPQDGTIALISSRSTSYMQYRLPSSSSSHTSHSDISETIPILILSESDEEKILEKIQLPIESSSQTSQTDKLPVNVNGNDAYNTEQIETEEMLFSFKNDVPSSVISRMVNINECTISSSPKDTNVESSQSTEEYILSDEETGESDTPHTHFNSSTTFQKNIQKSYLTLKDYLQNSLENVQQCSETFSSNELPKTSVLSQTVKIIRQHFKLQLEALDTLENIIANQLFNEELVRIN